VVPKLAEGRCGTRSWRYGGHDRVAVDAAIALTSCDAIALGQFSLARAAQAIGAATGRPVLTTPDSAVKKLRRLLGKTDFPTETGQWTLVNSVALCSSPNHRPG